MGFEPTQLALVELEPTPLDHSGKLSWNTSRTATPPQTMSQYYSVRMPDRSVAVSIWPPRRHAGKHRHTYTKTRRQTDTQRHRQAQTDTDRHRQTQTDRDRQRQTETDRDRRRQTETDRDGQRRTEMDRDRQS